MKRWENNVVQYYKNKTAGACPDCGSNNIRVEEHQNGVRKSISFLCKDCGSADHFDGFERTF